ncbi:hypothetical protein LCGC14_0935330 [marine sediment metagenome]|uniref:Uncharacterized protein n=1 Tax=marine sediment metagenome TaxID=412755 RepID=A0A0F9P7U5_9ZZZZ
MDTPTVPRFKPDQHDVQAELDERMQRADHYEPYDAEKNERVARELYASLPPAFHDRVKKILTAEPGGEHA